MNDWELKKVKNICDCQRCGYTLNTKSPDEIGAQSGNSILYKNGAIRCPKCMSTLSPQVVDLGEHK